jgi:hypothetical protein
MPDSPWETKFERLFQAGVRKYREGERKAARMFTTRDQAFLGTVGCTGYELYDYVEDFCDEGTPDVATVLALAAIRRKYFLEAQHGIPSQFYVDPQELPPKQEELEGFRWLPRIIAKARAKLRGELDPSIMYGCGGDRAFVESIGMTAPRFLQLVWDAGEDDRRIVDAVKNSIVANP